RGAEAGAAPAGGGGVGRAAAPRRRAKSLTDGSVNAPPPRTKSLATGSARRLRYREIAQDGFGRRSSASGLPASSAIGAGGHGPSQLSRPPSTVITVPE